MGNFAVLVYFKSLLISGVPELAEVIGQSVVEAMTSADAADLDTVRAAIKQAFSSLMGCDSSVVSSQISNLVKRLGESQQDQCELVELTLWSRK